MQVNPVSPPPTKLYAFYQSRYRLLEKLPILQLLECEKELKDIRVTELDLNNHGAITFYNDFIRVFNKVRPEAPLPRVIPPTLKKLMDDCIREPINDFSQCLVRSSPPASFDEMQNYLAELEIYNELDQWFKILDSFQKKGGKAIFLPIPSLKERYPPLIAISPKSQIYTICHAGLIRSQTMRQIVVSIKETLGQIHADLETPLSHGMTAGHDPATRKSVYPRPCDEDLYGSHYQEAFGVKRPVRFGADIEKSRVNDHFRQHYYAHRPSDGEKVFLTFMENGFSAMCQLANHNADLQGVSVVLFAEHDEISSCEIDPDMRHKIRVAYEMERFTPGKRRPLDSLTEEERRNVFWTYTQAQLPEEAPGSLDNILALFDRFQVGEFEDLKDEEIDRVFKIEAFRAWTHRLSGIFQPVFLRKRERDQ